MLKDSSPRIRTKASAAVGAYKGKKAFEALKPLVNDPNEHVREQVTIAIGWQGTTEAADILIEILKTEGRPAQQAAYWLGKIGDKRAIDALEEVMEHSHDARLRREAEHTIKALRTK